MGGGGGRGNDAYVNMEQEGGGVRHFFSSRSFSWGPLNMSLL